MPIDTTQDEDVVRTFIWGSCVSRDTFGFLPERFQLTTYVARQSLISAGNDASVIRSKLTPLSSAFQQRMVRGDLAGDLYRRIDTVGAEIDLVLIDLVDERSGVVDFGNGTYATKLSEFWGAGGRDASKNARLIPFGTAEHFSLWRDGAKRLMSALRDKDLVDRAVVLRADWASRFDTGETLAVPTWMMQPTEANPAYGPYFEELSSLGLRICALPAELALTSEAHKWGPSPFHYQDAAYEYFSETIRSSVNLDDSSPR
ncbi:DUF6270 domain-containing protein [Brachybacterium sp. AOP24-D1-21]|uniref:DUF6270 domain-containing protein n=1 Tax=Brachybacterium sp. AOP24-D1-21 TaxID=3457711 RepID=UPI004034AA92